MNALREFLFLLDLQPLWLKGLTYLVALAVIALVAGAIAAFWEVLVAETIGPVALRLRVRVRQVSWFDRRGVRRRAAQQARAAEELRTRQRLNNVVQIGVRR